MSDKGLSNEAAAAACKDGDPITKVIEFYFGLNSAEHQAGTNPTGQPQVKAESIIGQIPSQTAGYSDRGRRRFHC